MLKKLLTALLGGSLVIQGMSLPILADGADSSEDLPSETQIIEMYRLYNSTSGEHFYTKDSKEKNSLVSLGWKYEGIGWYAPQTSQTPVYRLYNQNSGDHHYTTDQNEKNTLVKLGWNNEGIGWYSDDSKTIPLYRQYNPNAKAGSHNYTTSKDENDSLCSIGWNAEGIGWYALEEGKPAPIKPTLDYEEIYKPLLDKAKKFINSKFNGTLNSYDLPPEFIGLVEPGVFSSLDDLGYAIQDFSGDGIPELVIGGTKYQNILLLYTLVENKPFNTFYGWARSGYNYVGGASFSHSGSNGAAYSVTGLFSLSEDGKDIIWKEYYFTEPYATYFNTTGSYSPQDSEYIGGFEVYYPISKRIQGMRQNLTLIPLSHWN